MATRAKKSPRPARATGTDDEARPAGSSESMSQSINPLADAYLASLVQLGVQTGQRWDSAGREFAENVRTAEATAVAGVPTAMYEQLARAAASQDPTILAPAYSAYLETVQRVYAKANQAYRNALRDYLQQVEDAWSDAQDEAGTKYAEFLGKVRKALAGLEQEPVDPASLALIGWTLLASAPPTAAFTRSP